MTRATIKDVSRVAGVSIKTVSRVLNKERYVSDDMRQKVEEAVARLNYHPSQAARTLAGKRSFQIGLIHDNPSPYYIFNMQAGVGAALPRGRFPHDRPAVRHQFARTGRRHRRADRSGAARRHHHDPAGDRRRHRARRIVPPQDPVVRVQPGTDLTATSAVYIDNVQAADDMTAYLISLGHRRIGFVTGHGNYFASGQRLTGYRQALQRAGIGFDAALVFPGQFDFQSGSAAAEALLALDHPPTAIFASSDDMAAGVLAAAHRLGVAVPDQLSVAGFDDTDLAQVVWPALTTIHQPIRDLGYAAADLLLEFGETHRAAPAPAQAARIVVRGSTATTNVSYSARDNRCRGAGAEFRRGCPQKLHQFNVSTVEVFDLRPRSAVGATPERHLKLKPDNAARRRADGTKISAVLSNMTTLSYRQTDRFGERQVAQIADKRRWLVVGLVFIAIVLNYVDRQILALLKPTLQLEFDWSDRDYSHMASAFQFAAALAFLGTGWFIDKVGLRWGFAIGVGVWSLAGMAHAFASTVSGFVASRAVLGAAESIGTPAAVKTAATYFNAKERSFVLGLGGIAPERRRDPDAVAHPADGDDVGLAGDLPDRGRARPYLGRRLARRPHSRTAERRARRRGAENRVVQPAPRPPPMGVILGKALTDQVWWFLLFFMPDLFHRLFGLTQGTLGLPVAFVYLMAALGGITGGFLPSYLMTRRGWTVNAARKTTMLIYALLILPVPLLVGVDSAWVAAMILGLALFAHQGFSTNIFGLTTDVFPARIVGSAIGIGAFAGNLSGMAMIEFAGWSLDTGRGYLPMMLVCAGTYLVALAAIHLILPRIVAVDEEEDGPMAARTSSRTEEPATTNPLPSS
jgi:ACS family hexuronate transporter-like MFS transporter